MKGVGLGDLATKCLAKGLSRCGGSNCKATVLLSRLKEHYMAEVYGMVLNMFDGKKDTAFWSIKGPLESKVPSLHVGKSAICASFLLVQFLLCARSTSCHRINIETFYRMTFQMCTMFRLGHEWQQSQCAMLSTGHSFLTGIHVWQCCQEPKLLTDFTDFTALLFEVHRSMQGLKRFSASLESFCWSMWVRFSAIPPIQSCSKIRFRIFFAIQHVFNELCCETWWIHVAIQHVSTRRIRWPLPAAFVLSTLGRNDFDRCVIRKVEVNVVVVCYCHQEQEDRARAAQQRIQQEAHAYQKQKVESHSKLQNVFCPHVFCCQVLFETTPTWRPKPEGPTAAAAARSSKTSDSQKNLGLWKEWISNQEYPKKLARVVTLFPMKSRNTTIKLPKNGTQTSQKLPSYTFHYQAYGSMGFREVGSSQKRTCRVTKGLAHRIAVLLIVCWSWDLDSQVP